MGMPWFADELRDLTSRDHNGSTELAFCFARCFVPAKAVLLRNTFPWLCPWWDHSSTFLVLLDWRSHVLHNILAWPSKSVHKPSDGFPSWQTALPLREILVNRLCRWLWWSLRYSRAQSPSLKVKRESQFGTETLGWTYFQVFRMWKVIPTGLNFH